MGEKRECEASAAGAAAADKSSATASAVSGKSDLKRAFAEDGALKTHVGGQALIEGIMMRGKYNWSVAVRTPDGSVYVEEHDLASGKDKNGWMYWPLVRGCRSMVESLALGFKALEIAMIHAFGEEDEPEGRRTTEAAEKQADASSDRFESGLEEPGREVLSGMPSQNSEDFSWKKDFGRPDTVIDALGAQRTLEVVSEPAASGRIDDQNQNSVTKQPLDNDAKDPGKKDFLDEEVEFGKKEMGLSMVLGLVLGVALFIVAPAFVTNVIVGEYDSNPVWWNIVDGLLRVAVFVGYLWLIGRMEDIRRMFGYHGAEHKTIHCYEHGLPLTPENARSFPRLHVRCGTAFLIMVMIIAIFVYTVIPVNLLIDAWGVPDGAPKLLLVIAIRILFLPVIAGISYEITVKWAGSHPENPLVKLVLWPGMQMQYLTTNEPDDGQIECAIAAMQKVLEREEAEQAKQAAAH
ncbi:DUF1385 domain-containing protein [Eggerthellaceae bacterium zg-893]|nr:DUF1385 domain-containing protein [Eggerthellaceae bacterium zg-893]